MRFDVNKLSSWTDSKELYLPGMKQLFNQSKSNILIVGAAVFELYELQGWIPGLKRKTGDIDLSVGVFSNSSFYDSVKAHLLSLGYKVDDYHPYRYHPAKKIPGGYTYIDLLAYPGDSNTKDSVASHAMGVADSFSFKGFNFAKKQTFALEQNVVFPNPFGFISLKLEGYLDQPVKRLKDFADVVELISGLVENGMHFEMDNLWKRVEHEPEAQRVKQTLLSMISDNPTWDLEEIRNDLKQRNFDEISIEITIPQRIKDFCAEL